MIKTVLFDVDGTILDTEFVMIKSLCQGQYKIVGL